MKAICFPRLSGSRFLRVLWMILLSLAGSSGLAHDIPNQRVDRSTQVTLRPGKLEVDYEVSLTELTLTQDLRRLIGSLPGADRSEWLSRYGEVTGPLNARGFLIHCDGRPLELRVIGFDLAVEEHPRYTFRLESALPETGKLVVHDTNYVSSEGTSRLAIRGRDGIEVSGDDLPTDVSEIAIRPVWQLADEEERRSRQVAVDFRTPAGEAARARQESADLSPPVFDATTAREPHATPSLSSLLDQSRDSTWIGLLAIAAALGAAHSVQPGHGKTLVSAVALGPGTRWYHPAILSFVTTLVHTGSVLLIAAVLWWSGSDRVVGLHLAISRIAGFAIAAGGLWRIGRSLSGLEPDDGREGPMNRSPGMSGLVGIGLAGGIVPCWDAVGLLVLSAAVNRLDLGVLLVLAFGVGMAAVLVAVGMFAARFKNAMSRGPASGRFVKGLSLLSGVLLAFVGLSFFCS